MKKVALPCGIWGEASLGYHVFTLHAVWALVEAARRHGIDLYADPGYRGLLDGPINTALPDGSMPGFNDNPGYELKLWAPVYELAYARWHKKEHGQVVAMAPRTSIQSLLYGADTVPEGNPIPTRSLLLKEAGYGLLRSPEVTVAGRFGIHGSGHGHPDKLNIVTYAHGTHFGVDPGSINYGVPLFFEWYKATISHNTVSVDERQQQRADARVTEWRAEAGETVLAGEAEVYPGVKFRRTLRLKGAVLEDRFECESETEHVYDWAFHSQGALGTSLEMKRRTEPVAKVSGYQHIKEPSEAATDGDWTATWREGKATLTLKVKGAPGTTVFTGKGPGPDPADDIALVLVRRKGTRVVFEMTHTYAKA
jgi:hypothetical protein